MDCAFVGAGSVAHEYASGLDSSRLDLVAVCDLAADRAAALAGEDARVYTDLDALLAAGPPPLVVNLTSHGAHAAVTDQCLEAGCHVFSEKPLALDAERATSLVETAETRGLALGCAPINHRGLAQRHVRTLLGDGRFGRIRLGYAHAHVGRVTEWHDDPGSFLEVGPLYDGAVYPLNALVSWFGPVSRVRQADAVDAWPDRESGTPGRAPHVEATIEFVEGPVVRLTASLYAPHRSREFNSLELHGDDGSLYLADTGALEADPESVQVGGAGREYVGAPVPRSPTVPSFLDGPERLGAAIDAGERPTAGARRAAHVVAVLNAIETASAERQSVPIEDPGIGLPDLPSPPVRPDPQHERAWADTDGGRGAAIDLPSVGFGCSRYQDGSFLDRIDSIATALDAGYRLFDSAELYGNEGRIGSLLASPGTPDRESLFVTSKVWNTNHEHVAEACRGSLEELGLDAVDCYMLHWPEPWAYQGPLRNLAEKPPAEQEAMTFPTDEEGNPERVEVPLTETWERLEHLHDRGLTRTLGLCNVSLDELRTITDTARIQPAIVQIERHPYLPQTGLVAACHERGIRVMAHSPLSAPGLLDEPVLVDMADDRGVSPAALVISWNVGQGVVPIPSSNDPDHVVENLAAAEFRLDRSERQRIATLADTEFER